MHRRRRTANALTAAVIFTLTGMTGCSTLMGRGARDEERLLSAAGFQLKLASTEERQGQLRTLPQRQLFPTTDTGGELRFVYADASGCSCMYVGSEAAKQRFERLALRERLSTERLMAARATRDAALDWDLWGPWYSPWY